MMSEKTGPDFKRTKNYKMGDWWDCTCEIICPCGHSVILDDDGEGRECFCGRRYLLVTFIEVAEKEEDG